MTTIYKYELCKLLAKWADVKIKWNIVPDREGWVHLEQIKPYEHSPRDYWDPFTDANQLELVKAGLRKEGIGYSIWWKPVIYHATLFRPGVEGDPLGVGMHHESESLALALAIQAMEEGR